MSQNLNQPRKDGTVLGGENPPPVAGVVLGGLEGVKHCLLSTGVSFLVA
ncbi:hypothetical protein F7734_57695 [Scytonema sp. UIC 10036]|nr:hypothetical protein [Scytonema sp. UIC 10036]MUH01401.1 hypothetical protein [Scytonema sp. UIC 10036]